RPSERPWGSGGNRPVRCAVLLGSGVLIGLVAEALLGASPGLCAEEATRIVGLALLGWGATAAAGAAFCLAHGVVPPRPDPASSGATLPGPAPVAVWGGPVLPIGGVLFLLGAAGVSLQAYSCLEALPFLGPDLGPDLLADYCGRGQAALTLGILYTVV